VRARHLVLAVALLGLAPRLASAGEQDASEANPLQLYQASRLRLVDSAGAPLGPASIGFDIDLLTRRGGEPTFLRVGGEQGLRLTIPAGLARLGDSDLRASHDARRTGSQHRRNVWIGVVMVAATSLVFIVAADQAARARGEPFGGRPNGAQILGGTLGASIGMLPLGGLMIGIHVHRLRQLTGRDMSHLADRRRLWDAVDAHNSELRRELDLPDDSRLDGPR